MLKIRFQFCTLAIFCAPAIFMAHALLGPSPAMAQVTAVPANDFLNSIGINTHISQGVNQASYVAPLQYTGIRNIRDGANHGDCTPYVALNQSTGVLVDIVAGNFTNHIDCVNTLADGGALLAIEGPNEPNNFPIVYNGQTGGGAGTWVPVAQYQLDLYSYVKNSLLLQNYPVFHVSEGGAETDNVGMQFLTIPDGAGTLMPDGTRYADYANPHNYVIGNGACHTLADNQAWNAEDATLRSCWDGLYGEYGVTWRNHFEGYSDSDLETLPRVTTETGWPTGGGTPVNEDTQGRLYLNLFLDAFKRGWGYTFIYEMRDREGGDTVDFGIFHTDSTPKIAATFIGNMTTILADTTSVTPGSMNYSIANEPETVHDLLLQKSDGTFYLAVWDERVPGTVTDDVTVDLGATFSSVNVYDPTVGTDVQQVFSNVSSVALSLSDHPIFLAIDGRGDGRYPPHQPIHRLVSWPRPRAGLTSSPACSVL